MGNVLGMSNQLEWNSKGKGVFTRVYVDKCRSACNKEYHLNEEEPEFIPPRDENLGLEKTNPAFDCMDVLKNGPGETSGVYYVRQNEN